LNSLLPCVKLTKHGKIPINLRSGKGEKAEGIEKTGFPLFTRNDTAGLKRNFSASVRNSFCKIRGGGSHG
jgi:hypothetical protein